MRINNYLSRICVELFCGAILISGTSRAEEKTEYQPKLTMRSISVTSEDRNKDNLKDLVIKYENGCELVLYAHRNKIGNIEYKPNK